MYQFKVESDVKFHSMLNMENRNMGENTQERISVATKKSCWCFYFGTKSQIL